MAKLSSKKKKIIIISVVLAVVIAVSSVVGYKLTNKGLAVQMHTIGRQDITTVINATADVEAGARREYKVETMATVKEVFVKVGDKVKEGDILATLDTSDIDKQLQTLRTQYNSQKKAYEQNAQSVNQAKKDLAAVEQEIKAVNKRIDELSKNTTVPSMPENTEIPKEVFERIEKALSDYILGGGTSKEEMKAIVVKVIDECVADKTITKEQGELIKSVINQNIDTSNDINNEINQITDMASAQMELATLTVRKQLYTVMSNDSLAQSSKSIMKATQEMIDLLQEQRSSLAGGWKADFDGIITQVNVAPGAKTTLIQPGIVLEGTDTMTAAFTLGKYDIQKVKVGMPCKISVVNGEYDGEVAFISPTAESGGATSAILDNISSSIGISGLGSLTGSTDGVRCEITIKEPDEKVIIGLDANVEIIIGEQKDVVAIPVEAIKMSKEGKYCLVYNEETKSAEKRMLTVGSSSDSYYEVIEGLKEGDKVIVSELDKLETALENGDDTRVYEKTTAKK